MTEQIGQKIIEKIKEAHIKPKPRWEFLLKNYVVWAIFAIAIFIGSLATGVMIFMIKHAEWENHPLEEGFFQQVLINLPFFWLIILIIFIVIAFYNLKHTKKGYKYNPLFIVLASIIISIIIGSIFYATGGGEKLEDTFFRRFPFYQNMMRPQGRLLINPEAGRIAGVVVEVNQEYITIKDFRGGLWKIVTTTDQFIVGQRVRVFGKMMQPKQFEADIMKPFFQHTRPSDNHCLNNQACPPLPMP